jgi:hypothetical protein
MTNIADPRYLKHLLAGIHSVCVGGSADGAKGAKAVRHPIGHHSFRVCSARLAAIPGLHFTTEGVLELGRRIAKAAGSPQKLKE